MKQFSTFSIKRSFNFINKPFLTLAILFSIGFSAMAQSPYCSAPYYYNYGSCTYYYMSVNAIDIKQGSTSLFYRAHNTFGYNGCNAASGDYTLNAGSGGSALFSLKAGGTYQMGFTTGPSYACNMFIWIDLNNDKDFSDANEYISILTATTPKCNTSGVVPANTSTLTYYSITIPTGITPGTTRMRIRSTYYGNGCYSSSLNGCQDMYYGECEDFTIALTSDPNDAGISAVAQPLCSPALVATLTNLGNNDLNPVKIGWSVNGVAQRDTTYTTTLNPGKSANITLKNAGNTDYNFVDGTTYKVKVFTYSPNNVTDTDIKNDTTITTFSYVGPSGTPTTYASRRCGPGRGILKATTPFATDSVLWYNASSGGNVVAMGKNTLSPPLVLGVTTFYAQSFKIGKKSLLDNGIGAGNSYWNGQPRTMGFIDITPTTGMFLDSFVIKMFSSTSGTVFDVFMRTGTSVGYQTSATGWTQILKSYPARVATAATGGYFWAYIKLPSVMLNSGTTYGFHIVSTTNPFLMLYAAGGITATNADATMKTTYQGYGSAPFGVGGYLYNYYGMTMQMHYRPAICPSSRVPIALTVDPSPNGAAWIKGTPFQTPVTTSNGSVGSPDIVANGDQLTYDLVPPTGYTSSNHGTDWKTFTPVVKTKSGTDIPITAGIWSYTPPSGSTPGKLTITPKSTPVDYTDNMIIVSMRLEDIKLYQCDSTILKHIFIAPRPQPDFKFNQPICDGDAVLFTDLSKISTGFITYKWDFNTGNPADTSTLSDVVFKFPTFGTYDVKLTTFSTPYGYTESKIYQVVVTEIPKVDFKVLNACEKLPVTFKNNTTIGAGIITYDWDFGDPSTTADRSTLKEPSWTYANPKGYKVRLRASANGCSAELSKNANQFATPKAKFTEPGLICDKSDVQFMNNSTISSGNIGYIWDMGDGGVSTVANPIHQYSNFTPKTVKMKTVSEFGCVDSMVKTITLKEAPNAEFTWGPACNLSNTSFTWKGTKPGGWVTTFSWDFAGTGSSTLENPQKKFDVVGRKNVTLTMVSNNGCSDVVTKEINVKLQSKADFIAEDVCEGDDAVFTNTSLVTAGNLNYNWKFGNGQNSSQLSPRHRYTINGVSTTFNVTLVAIVPGGCSDSITKDVTVNATPISNFSYTQSGRLVDFKANQAGNTLYQWRFGDGGNSTSPNTQYHYLNFVSGKYTACLAVVNAAGCVSETCKDINITGGVDKLTKLTGVKVYPNPNKGNFTVTVEDPKSDISIAVYNLLGEVVKTIETNPLKSVYSVDLNAANGVYMVKVTNGGLVSTQKVTINK